jgi:A/G-specific adenine glycosylase
MDLGATVCIRKKPNCLDCPIQSVCVAYQQNETEKYPATKKIKKLPCKSIFALMIINDKKEILLEKRPPTGIWGSLFSLPECPIQEDIVVWCKINYGCHVILRKKLPTFRHTFSHFHLDITPIILDIKSWLPTLNESQSWLWYNYRKSHKHGLPAPIKKLLETSGELICLE